MTDKKVEWELARIRDTMLGIEDHGILSSFLYLDYAYPGEKIGGLSQGFGGYGLGGEYAAKWLRGVLDAVGVYEWKDLKGKMVWVDADMGKIHAIRGLDTGKEFRPWDGEEVVE